MKRAALIGAMLAAALPASAAAGEVKPLFAASEPLRLTIRGPIGRIARAAERSEAAEAAVLVAGAETHPIRLSARGITRRRKDVCNFPPLRVEFSQPPAATSPFAGQKRLKLVTHCQPSESFGKHLLLEYAAYRMFNVLTPASFRVRLARIDYVEPDGGRPVASRLGFFIEDVDHAARRNEMVEARVGDRVPAARLAPRDAARVAVFHYLIGNLDWAITAGPQGAGCCHNSRLIAPAATAAADLVPIPYDFDHAGIVDAPYATPPEQVRVSNIRERRYRGYCRHNAEAQAAAAEAVAARAALVGVLSEVPDLDERARRKAASYLDGFFDKVGSAAAIQANLLKTCLN